MDTYVTGTMIKKLREERKMTQADLANKLHLSDKTISKWETGKGYPDIGLLEELGKCLGVSIIELLSGKDIKNTNRSFNMYKCKFYICPICGNIITGVGESVVSCHGIVLPCLQVEEDDVEHILNIEKVEDEYCLTINHEMNKKHYISFIAALKDKGIELVKLYPEGEAFTRCKIEGTRYIYYYCNRHGLFVKKV